MPDVPGFRRSFRFPWRSRRQIAAEIDEEIGFHLDMRREELMSQGVDENQAKERAEREFGDLERARRSLRGLDQGAERRRQGSRWLEELHQDTRFAVRTLRRSPGFAALAVLVLALAIGANTSLFSIINTVLLRPLKIDSPQKVWGVFAKHRQNADDFQSFSYPDYLDLRESSESFEALAAYNPVIAGISDGDVTDRAMGLISTADYFDVFGVPLALGRTFTAAEERPGSNLPVVVISHGLWQQRGGDRRILGRTIRINGTDFSVIGVAAEGFTGSIAILAPEFWLPTGVYGSIIREMMGEAIDLSDRRQHAMMLVGRLADGIGEELAGEELSRIAGQLSADHPEFGDHDLMLARLSRMGLSTRPMNDSVALAGSVTLMGMAAIVLLIACLNLANMLLARSSTRRTEVAIRQSLGGGRKRIVRQLLTEGMLLSLTGGLLGLLLSLGAGTILNRSIAPLLPFGEIQLEFHLDPRVLAATLLLACLGTVFFALGPALELVRGELLQDLKEGSRDGSGSARLGPRNVLVVAQIALSLGLITAAGLFVRGAWNAAEADPGFDMARGVVAEIDGSFVAYDEARMRQLYSELVSRLRALPGAEFASLSSNVPFSPMSENEAVFRPGSEDDSLSAERYVVGADYFETLGVSLLRGRGFSAAEESAPGPVTVAIIDRALSEQLWPGEDPLGRNLEIGGSEERSRRTVEIIGIAPDLRQQLLSSNDSGQIYLPFGRDFRPAMWLHVRPRSATLEGQAAMMEELRNTVRGVDPDLPILSLRRLESLREDNLELWLVRAGANLFLVFGSVALLLAVIGVYGVKAYTVARQDP